MAEGSTTATRDAAIARITGGARAPGEPMAKAASYKSYQNNAFGPRPGNLNAGPKRGGEPQVNIQAKVQRLGRREAAEERQDARQRAQMNRQYPFRERGVGAAFSPKNAPANTPRVQFAYSRPGS